MAHHGFEADDDPDDPFIDLREIEVWHPDRLQYMSERSRQKRILILRRRKIRDAANPYDVTYEAFTKSYRLSQDLVRSLIRLIRPHVRVTTSALALPLEIKVLGVLSFDATGSYQTPLGRQFDVAISQPTLCTYIEEITKALNEDDILSLLIRFPANVREVNLLIDRNRALGGKISNVVGYTDGSLIKIKKPSVANNRHAFIGRKSFASMNAMFTCDRRLYIMNVNPKFPGSTFDSFVFQGSALRRRMMELYPQRRCHLLGDSGYALEPWMLVPFAREDRPEEGTPEDRYNHAHASDRNAVERCIGVLKMKFRALNDERVLHYHYVKVARLINAISVVHNLGILANVPDFINENDCFNDNVHGGLPEEDLLHENILGVLDQGRAIRDEIVRELNVAIV